MFMQIPCTNHRKCILGILLAVIVIAVVIALVFTFKPRTLASLLEGEGEPSYRVAGYSVQLVPLGTSVEGKIPQEQITELLETTMVKKGKAFESLPEPCFELRMYYSDGDDYLIVVGKDGAISVGKMGDLDHYSYWKDPSGQLFSALYQYHLDNGGEPFE